MKIEKITPQIAALYLGQKATVNHLGTLSEDVFEISTITLSDLSWDLIEVTPHLRSLETITEEECQMLYKIETGQLWTDKYDGEENTPPCKKFWFQDEYCGSTGSPLVWLKMLEMGFDLFGLIPAGLAKEIKYGK